MGRRKWVKRPRSLGEISYSSSSSSSSSWSSSSPIKRVTRNRRPEIRSKANQLQVEKTSKKNKDESENDSSSNHQEASINDLPLEMLEKVLKNVDTPTLFSCRLVNRAWSGISSGILTSGSNSGSDSGFVLKFVSNGDKIITEFAADFPVIDFDSLSPGRILDDDYFDGAAKTQNSSLNQFLKCINKSRNCPYARFSFDLCLAAFQNKDWTAFLSTCDYKVDSSSSSSNLNPNQNRNQNQRIKINYLNLKIHQLHTPTPPTLLTENVRDLLVNKIPHLEEFGLDCSSSFDSRELKLFPLSQNKGAEAETKVIPVPVSVLVQLANLKVLHFEQLMFVAFPGIVQDLLNAAVNLKSVRVTDNREASNCSDLVGIFQFLHSRQKLHLLQNVRIVVNEYFIHVLENLRKSQIETEMETEQRDFSLAFKLHELKLYTVPDFEDPTFAARAATFISTILESSKNTLRQLKISFGFCSDIQLPKFTNLTTLKLRRLNQQGGEYSDDDDDDIQQIFPAEIRTKDIFPAVCHLDLQVDNWRAGFPQEDSIPIFPSVKTLGINVGQISPDSVPALTLMCPNLLKFQIKKDRHGRHHSQLNFLQVGRLIWTHMRQLESLEVDLDLEEPENSSWALDSCFTGISEANCQRLYDLKEAERLMKKWGSRGSVPESELTAEREHPSLLDMTDLKKMTINPYFWGELLSKEEFFKENLTWISQEYAFKLIPHLQLNDD